MHLPIRLTHEDDQTSDFRVQPLTTAVLPQRSQGKSAVTVISITVQLSSENTLQVKIFGKGIRV